MGQPVTVIEKPSARPDTVRFETNRVITGMGHENFRSLDEAQGDSPAARLARTLLAHPGVRAVHLNGNAITVQLGVGASPAGLKPAIEELYLYYRDGVVPEVPAGAEAAE